MGPAQPPFDDTGSWNAPPRFGSALLVGVGETGVRPVLTDADRQAFTADLTYWRAAVVVLVPNARNVDQLRATLVDLLGRPPRLVGGVQLWQIPPSG
jgi:hypothetical protein